MPLIREAFISTGAAAPFAPCGVAVARNSCGQLFGPRGDRSLMLVSPHVFRFAWLVDTGVRRTRCAARPPAKDLLGVDENRRGSDVELRIGKTSNRCVRYGDEAAAVAGDKMVYVRRIRRGPME